MKKRNKAIIIILICLVVIGSLFAYSECNFKYELIDLETAYEQDLISYDDLLSIAYYRSGSNFFNEDVIDENFIPKEKGELSKIKQHQINKAFAIERNYRYTIFNFSDYEFYYYGEYNGYIVFSRVYTNGNPGLTIQIIDLDGVKFSMPLGKEIYLYKKL